METELNIRNLELHANWPHFIPWKTQKIQFLGISHLIEIENTQNMGLMNSHLRWKGEKITESRHSSYWERSSWMKLYIFYQFNLQTPLCTLYLFKFSLNLWLWTPVIAQWLIWAYAPFFFPKTEKLYQKLCKLYILKKQKWPSALS